MMGEAALCGRGCCYIRSSLFACSLWAFTVIKAATLIGRVSRIRLGFQLGLNLESHF